MTPRGEGTHGVLDVAGFKRLNDVLLRIVSIRGDTNARRRDRIFRKLCGGLNIIEVSGDIFLDAEECGLGGGELQGLTLYLTLPDLEAGVCVNPVKSGQFILVVVVDVVVVATAF